MTTTNIKKASIVILLLSGNLAFGQYYTENTPERQTIATGPGRSITYSTRPLQLNEVHWTEPQKAAWTKTIWRDVDATEKANAPFVNNSEKRGQTTLASMLLEGVSKGLFSAYNGSDDEFKSALSKQEFMTLLFGAGSEGFNPEQVTRYRIQEEWRFDISEKKMITRITGIAPLSEIVVADGVLMNEPVFWVYYTDVKNFLGLHKTVVPADGKTCTWAEYLDGRKFASKIIKVDGQNSHEVPREDTDELHYIYK